MSKGISRRAAIGMGAAAGLAATAAGPAGAASAVPGSGSAGSAGARFGGAAEPVSGPDKIQAQYARQKAKAGGVWHSHVAAVDPATGTLQTVIEDDADFVIHGWSVQKLAVATAVMDKIDRGQASLGQKLDLQGDIILGGSGIYHLHTVWGDDITVANFLTALLLVSDNTAVRMCGRVVPALEINAILAAKGFVHTRVEPVANPNRFYLGVTTPRETHDLLWRLANKTLLSPSSCNFLLGILRWINGYSDGIRRNMSSAERSRVASKYGANVDDLGAARHEAGIMFGADGAPKLTYAFFAEALSDVDNYGATQPAVQAHAVLGRTLFDTVAANDAGAAARRPAPVPYRAIDGL